MALGEGCPAALPPADGVRGLAAPAGVPADPEPGG
jgi:hypothetical protein